MQLSPPSRHSIPLWSKYSPQHPVLKHRQFMFRGTYYTKNQKLAFPQAMPEHRLWKGKLLVFL
jgi:hypothetical protein